LDLLKNQGFGTAVLVNAYCRNHSFTPSIDLDCCVDGFGGDHRQPSAEHKAHDPEKRVPDLIGDGHRFSDSSGARSWIFRYSTEDRDPTGQPVRDETGKARGISREMGLGSCFVVSPEQGRELAIDCRRLRRQGIDPIEARRTAKTQAALNAAKSTSFTKCAEDYIKSYRAGRCTLEIQR
jgi:hypothetical protein